MTYSEEHPDISENLLTCYDIARILKESIGKVRETI